MSGLEDARRKARTRFCLFGAALLVAAAAMAGIVLFGLRSSYAPAAICCFVALFALYCAPIYLRSALLARAAAKLIAALADGARTLDELAELAGFKRSAAQKYFEKALAAALICGYAFEGDEIVRTASDEDEK